MPTPSGRSDECAATGSGSASGSSRWCGSRTSGSSAASRFLLWDDRWRNGHLERIEPVETEIGWTLGRESWNQGYATEGALACRDYALESLGVTRVISLIASENVASIRAAEKIGETFERVIAGDFFRFPVDLYSLEVGAEPAR